MALIFFLLLLHADDGSSNNNGYGVLKGDTTYADVDGRITRAFVRSPWPNASSDVRLIDEQDRELRLGPDLLAVRGRANCWPPLGATCVDERVRASGEPATLVGFFPISGDWIVRFGDQRLKRMSRAQFDLVEPRTQRNISETVAALARGEETTLAELAQTFANGSNPRAPERCMEPRYFNRKLKVGPDGYVEPDCLPHVFYSWGDWKRLKWLQLRLNSFTWSDRILINQPLFMARSPVATFGFGSHDEAGGYPMRVEIAPGVRFKVMGINTPWPDCGAQEARRTVYIRALGEYDGARPWGDYAAEDFMVCSSDVIKSWSYGTKESYDEIVRDLREALAGGDWDGYVTYRRRAGFPYRPFFLNINADNHPFTQSQLIHTLRRLLDLTARDRGAVYTNPAYGRPGA